VLGSVILDESVNCYYLNNTSGFWTKPFPLRRRLRCDWFFGWARQLPYKQRRSFVWSEVVAPRAYWKGYLNLSLVSCPVALFPASSEREKISFNQINKKTGNRIRYRKIDAETEEEVDSSEIIKGYEVGKGQYLEIEPEELEAIAIESKRTIEIDEFVPKKEIDELYLNSRYYLVRARTAR
jgi:Ku70/Ku80 beta-barrel domain